MTTIFGLPAHVLLVHGIEVLAPLTALLEILCAIPASREAPIDVAGPRIRGSGRTWR